MVTLRRKPDGTPAVWCDPEIADLVSALNAGGVPTVASCSGHRERPGNIALADGRELIIAKDYAEARAIEACWNTRHAPLQAEVEALRELCGMAYQLAGAHDAPEKWLDALSNAAAGRPFSTNGLLPYWPQAVCDAEVRARELEREIEALRAEVERLTQKVGRLQQQYD